MLRHKLTALLSDKPVESLRADYFRSPNANPQAVFTSIIQLAISESYVHSWSSEGSSGLWAFQGHE